MTCPKHDKKKGVLESFSNCGHRDTTDCINEEQGLIVLSYLQEMNNNTVVMEYLQRMLSQWSPILCIVPTCAIEQSKSEYNRCQRQCSMKICM